MALKQCLPRTLGAISGTRDLGMPARKNTKFPAALSPHVTIYAWPIAALSSITYRVTGAMLCFGMYGIGAASLVSDPVTLIQGFQSGVPALTPVVKLAAGFPLMYHYFGAVRHIYWEKNPLGLGTESIHQSSLALIGVSCVGTLGLVCTTLSPKESS